ncbi:MAG TPA: nitrilase-related carbon-nitrogen hydrolase [Polyangiaceae bacterium]|nr:nitrilase-related carbon-nitrogen hydrolase [Polyangiaceae bacterium]
MISPARINALFRNRGRGAREAALAACIGILTALGEPGAGLAPLFLFGLVALSFLAVRARSLWGASAVGLAFGTGMFAVIMVSAVDWGLIVPFALTLVGVLLYGLPLSLWAHWSSRRLTGAQAFAATVAAWSLCMDLGDLVGFPSKCEALSSVAFAPLLMAGARLVGTNVLCGLMIAGAVGTGTQLARLRAPRVLGLARALRPLAASFLWLLALSGLARVTAAAPSGALTVGVPQMNVSSDYFRIRQAIPDQTNEFEALFSQQVAQLADVDLLALTETYDGTFPLQVPRLRQRFQNYAKLQHQPVLLTSYLVSSSGGGYNAVGGINADGQLVGVHRKVNLAPFGEVELDRGDGFHALALLPNAKVGVLICQEALLGEGPRAFVRDGANLLVTTTSDISFGSGILSFGHLAAARLRAIETGRSMVWASAGGPSGASDRWGAFTRAAPFREAKAARMNVELYSDVPPFLRWSWLVPILSAGFLLVLLVRRGPRVVVEPRAEPVATVRGVLELALALLLAFAASIASPALVELVSGEPARAKQSVLELLGRKKAPRSAPSLARFHTDVAHSADGALAYYLDFYGLRESPASTPLYQAQPTLSDAAQALEQSFDFPARQVPLDFSALPRTAALVRTKTGEFGVLSSNSLHALQVFSPVAGSQVLLSTEQARTILEARCVLPTVELNAAAQSPH